MNSVEAIDARYYQVAPPRSLGERMVVAARERIYGDFTRLCRPTPESTLLDVGASDILNDGANLLERKHPQPERITAVGLGAAQEFQVAFPKVSYRQVEAGADLPFPDKHFDIAFSNAVLEHVGGPAQRRVFVAELARVARKAFIAIPNRLFPVEHHTAIPILHYWPASFEAACRALGKTEWLNPANLTLIGHRELQAAAPIHTRHRIGYTGIALGPFSSNLFLLLEDEAR